MLLGRVASRMVAIVLVLFVLERYGSAPLAGAATFLAIFPGLVVSPVAGALLDRHGRRRLIVLDHLVAGAAFALVAALSFADALPAALLLAIVTAASLTQPLSFAGMRTLFPLVVPRPLWDQANAVDSNGYALSDIVAPAIGGGLVALVGGEAALIAAGAIFAVSAAVMAGVRDPGPAAVPGTSIARDAWDGLVHVARHPTLRGLALSVSTSNLANGIFYIAVPVLVLERLGGTADVVGRLFAVIGVAAFVSVLLFGRIGTEGRERGLMTASLVVVAAAFLPMIAVPSLTAVAISAVVIGLAIGPYDLAMFALRQRRTDAAWFGRAFAVSMALNYAGMPIGSALGGALAAGSPELALGVAVVAVAAAALMTVALVPPAAAARGAPHRHTGAGRQRVR